MPANATIRLKLATLFACLSVVAVAEAVHRGGSERHVRGALLVSGNVGHLTPGVSRDMTLTIRNRTSRRLRIRRVSSRVLAAPVTCPGRYLRIAKYRGGVRIGAWRIRRIRVRVTLSASAPNSCQGSRFKLGYRAVAVGG